MSILGDANGRIAAIDGLRALAVGLVFAHHAFPTYIPGGFIGVDIFFVISGFVITTALLRDGIEFRRFYTHRFLRIIPPIIPILMFILICGSLGVWLAEPRDVFFSALSFMNWARAFEISDGGHLGHFWSLGIEEQFYFIWPLVLALFIKKLRRPLPILGLLIITTLAWQIALFASGASFERVYNGLDTRASQLLIGCLLSFVVRDIRIPSSISITALAILITSTLFLLPESRFYLSAGIGIIALLSALIVANLAQKQERWHWPFLISPTQWVGSRSYAIYLWHYPLLGLFRTAGMDNILAVGSAVLVTFIASEASMRLFERPARRWRNLFFRGVAVDGAAQAGRS